MIGSFLNHPETRNSTSYATVIVSLGSVEKRIRVKITRWKRMVYDCRLLLPGPGPEGSGGGGGGKPQALSLDDGDPDSGFAWDPWEGARWTACGMGWCIEDPCDPSLLPPAGHQYSSTWCWARPADSRGGDLWFEVTGCCYDEEGNELPLTQYDGPWGTLEGQVDAGGELVTESKVGVWQGFDDLAPYNDPEMSSAESKLFKVRFDTYLRIFNPWLGRGRAYNHVEDPFNGNEYGVGAVHLKVQLCQASGSAGGKVRLLLRGAELEEHHVGGQEVVHLNDFDPWTRAQGKQAYDVTQSCVVAAGPPCASIGPTGGWDLKVETVLDDTWHDYDEWGDPPLRWTPHSDPKEIVHNDEGAVYFEIFGEQVSAAKNDVTLRVGMQITPRDGAPDWTDTENTVWSRLLLTVHQTRVVDEDGEEVKFLGGFSDPHPVVTLDEVAAGEVQIEHNAALVPISGEVTCAIADVAEEPEADITQVTITIYAGEALVVPVELDPTQTPSPLRPFPFRGTFGPVTYRLPLPGLFTTRLLRRRICAR